MGGEGGSPFLSLVLKSGVSLTFSQMQLPEGQLVGATKWKINFNKDLQTLTAKDQGGLYDHLQTLMGGPGKIFIDYNANDGYYPHTAVALLVRTTGCLATGKHWHLEKMSVSPVWARHDVRHWKLALTDETQVCEEADFLQLMLVMRQLMKLLSSEGEKAEAYMHFNPHQGYPHDLFFLIEPMDVHHRMLK
jgi:hypothetical protein